MKKRQWTSEQKLQIVMRGIKGRAVSEICNEYQIGQSQYYLWRDQFLTNAGKVFEMPKTGQQQSRLERENEKLKAMVGELTMELKKSGSGSNQRDNIISLDGQIKMSTLSK